MRVDYTENVSQEIKKKISDGFCEYEREKNIRCNYKKFAFSIRDKNNEVIAGLIGYALHNEIYIDDLWVDESMRGRGLGKKLIGEVEKKFRGKGFDNMNLVTNGFQAPGFYKKCGFKLEFVRENKKDPKFNKYFFIKRF